MKILNMSFNIFDNDEIVFGRSGDLLCFPRVL